MEVAGLLRREVDHRRARWAEADSGAAPHNAESAEAHKNAVVGRLQFICYSF